MMTIWRILSVCFTAVAVSGLRGTETSKTLVVPESGHWFCHGLECPAFDVLEKQEKYEVRKYGVGRWVSTTIGSHSFLLATSLGFKVRS